MQDHVIDRSTVTIELAMSAVASGASPEHVWEDVKTWVKAEAMIDHSITFHVGLRGTLVDVDMASVAVPCESEAYESD